MSIFEDSNTLLFVATITNGLGDTNAWTAAAQPSGSVVFVKVSDNTVEEGALAADTEYRVIGKTTGGVVHYSPIFTTANIKNKAAMDQEARVEQVTYLGYNGTSGSMDAANSTYYGLGIVLDHTFGTLNNSPLILTAPYKSDATATQYEVANGLALVANSALKRQPHRPIVVELVNSGTSTATSAGVWTVQNGSTTVTVVETAAGDASKYNGDAGTIVAGDLIRFGHATTETYPVYKVVSTTGAGASATIVLDRPYEGTTNASLAAASVGVVPIADIGDYGLKLTGVSVTDANFNPVTDEPFVVSFTLETGDFDTATTTYTTAPVLGSGTYQQVAALEAYCQFQRKTKEVSAYPPTVRLFQAVSGESYHLYSFEIWDDKYVSTTTGIKPISPTRIVIAEDKDLTEAFNTVLTVSLLATVY
jgi:hypothetical protein